MRTIVLADRDPEVARDLSSVLSRAGYQVGAVHGFEEARTSVLRSAPDMLVTDLAFPDGSGIDLVATSVAAKGGARCVVLTFHGGVSWVAPAFRAGAVGYLAKPASAEEVLGVLEGRPVLPPVPERGNVSRLIGWRHLSDLYRINGGNFSKAARAVGTDRAAFTRSVRKVLRSPEEAGGPTGGGTR